MLRSLLQDVSQLTVTALLLAPLAGLAAQPNLPPGRPADFRPFRYECSTEQLAEELSAAQMKRAEAELNGKDGLWNINARLEGATDTSILRIVVEDNADGIHGDNIDLVDAGFVIASRSSLPGP